MADQSKKRSAPDAAGEKLGFWTFLKTKCWARVLLIVVLVLALGISGVVIAYHEVMDTSILVDGDNNTEDDDGVLDDDIATKPEEKEQYMNILLCGIDYKENTGRGKLTDVMMVIHLDFVNQTVDILQVPRDSYIGRDYSTGKLNAIYGSSSNGGIENLARKINSMLQIPLDYYVILDMDGFEDIVDSIGGVTVDSPYSFTLEGITIVKGVQMLDGKAANKFVRERHAYAAGDLTRMKMQQIFLNALVKKCLSLGSTEIVKLAPKVFQYLTTDMTLNQALSLYQMFSGMTLDSMQFHSCEVSSFTDSYDGLSKLSIHARPLADLLNEYFRENGETVNWTELGILEYVTNYSYDGVQNQYQKEGNSEKLYTSSTVQNSRPAVSNETSSEQTSSETENSSTLTSDTSSESTTSSVESDVSSDVSSETSSADESTSSERTSSETSSDAVSDTSSQSSSLSSESDTSSALDDPEALKWEEATSADAE